MWRKPKLTRKIAEKELGKYGFEVLEFYNGRTKMTVRDTYQNKIEHLKFNKLFDKIHETK